MPEPTGMQKLIEAARVAAGGESASDGRAKLAEQWKVSIQAIHKFERQNYLPLDRAKFAAEYYGVPLRELVRPDIREAMDTNA